VFIKAGAFIRDFGILLSTVKSFNFMGMKVRFFMTICWWTLEFKDFKLYTI